MLKTMKRMSVAASAGVAIMASCAAHAAVVFDSGVNIVDQINLSDRTSDNLTAGRFVLSANFTLDGLSWTGDYLAPSPLVGDGVAADEFLAVLIPDIAGRPGLTSLGQLPITGVSRTPVGGVFTYEGSIAPTALPAGQYWISILNNTVGDDDLWFWMSNSAVGTGNIEQLTGSTATFAPLAGTLDFTLSSTAVPLPGALPFMLCGLGGLFAVRRARRAGR